MARAPGIFDSIAAIGRFLAAHPQLPWVRAARYDVSLPPIMTEKIRLSDEFVTLDESAGLGLAASIALGCELSDLGALRQVYGLPEIPMPARFRELFRDWEEGLVEFVEFLEE